MLNDKFWKPQKVIKKFSVRHCHRQWYYYFCFCDIHPLEVWHISRKLLKLVQEALILSPKFSSLISGFSVFCCCNIYILTWWMLGITFRFYRCPSSTSPHPAQINDVTCAKDGTRWLRILGSLCCMAQYTIYTQKARRKGKNIFHHFLSLAGCKRQSESVFSL